VSCASRSGKIETRRGSGFCDACKRPLPWSHLTERRKLGKFLEGDL